MVNLLVKEENVKDEINFVMKLFIEGLLVILDLVININIDQIRIIINIVDCKGDLVEVSNVLAVKLIILCTNVIYEVKVCNYRV